MPSLRLLISQDRTTPRPLDGPQNEKGPAPQWWDGATSVMGLCTWLFCCQWCWLPTEFGAIRISLLCCACSDTEPRTDPHVCPCSRSPSVSGVSCTHPALPFGPHGGSPGPRLPSCNGVLTLHSPFRHRASIMRLPSCSAFCSSTGTLSPSVGIFCGANSRPRQASSCAQGTNASDLADMALSALPAGSMLARLSASTGAVSTTGRVRPHSCAPMPEDSTSLASVFAIVYASPRQSSLQGFQGGQVSRPLLTPPSDFSRFSVGKSGGFKHSERRLVARHSEAAPSPSSRFSRARESNGNRTEGMCENENNLGAGRAACTSLFTLGEWMYCYCQIKKVLTLFRICPNLNDWGKTALFFSSVSLCAHIQGPPLTSSSPLPPPILATWVCERWS